MSSDDNYRIITDRLTSWPSFQRTLKVDRKAMRSKSSLCVNKKVITFRSVFIPENVQCTNLNSLSVLTCVQYSVRVFYELFAALPTKCFLAFCEYDNGPPCLPVHHWACLGHVRRYMVRATHRECRALVSWCGNVTFAVCTPVRARGMRYGQARDRRWNGAPLAFLGNGRI